MFVLQDEINQLNGWRLSGCERLRLRGKLARAWNVPREPGESASVFLKLI